MSNENIAKAFIKAQQEMSNAIKDSKNPYYKSNYADLNSVREACIPALNKHGIAVLQPTIEVDGKNYVKTILLHESGETIESLTQVLFSKNNDAQAQGTGITYARRYGLQSLVCIGAEDDDGNKASNKDPKKKINPKPETEKKINPKPETDEEMFELLRTSIKNKGTLQELEILKNHNGTVKAMGNMKEDLRTELNTLFQKRYDELDTL